LKESPWRQRLLDTTRGQILSLLRTRDCTVEDIATQLQLTDNAVRAHLISLDRDGLVVRAGTRPGSRKPHVVYALTSAIEQVFPKSYGPLIDLILTAVAKRMEPARLRQAMRAVGRKIAEQASINLTGKSREQRMQAAVRVLGELGGVATVEKAGKINIIKGRGCPIAAATAYHPEACLIAESLLREITGRSVKENCRRGPQPSCCFEIH
jgi:predicted ArsR family transcriptional regulator